MALDLPPQLLLPRGSVLSHASAARFWQLPLPVDHDALVHLTLPMCRGRWAQTLAVVHRRDLAPPDIVKHDGLLITSAMRTLLDLPSLLPLGASVAAADAALRLGLVTRPELLSATGVVMGRGAKAIRSMGRLADASAESPLESEARVLLTLADLAPPETQYTLRDNGLFIARLDFAWPDSRDGLQADGFEFHSEREDYRRDREQDNAFKRLRWNVPRVCWEHVYREPDYVIDLMRSLVA